MRILPLLALTVLSAQSLALPSSRARFEARLARRAGDQQVPLVQAGNDTDPPDYNDIWAGALLNAPEGTYKSITATFTVPTPKHPAGGSGPHSAAVWVGIDGDSCYQGLLQTGVDSHIDSRGSVWHNAWYEWFPDLSADYAGFDVRAGDSITASVIVHSPRSGTASIMNHRTGRSAAQRLTSEHLLCGEDAEWIVEDFGRPSTPFADFGQVVFTGAQATTAGGVVGPDGARVLDILQKDRALTKSVINGSTVTVTYIEGSAV
ncbi:peptidase A4 family-domain-containing protein [Phanerochaete sordida]|uniref:Peptidase A4 family-domain-containing protein n=1 Tax=Phanerochaete sordida TaxID=48140 RepID=A0A9P3GSQ4_9APHY|nr:peptidase A4 family-domain-containing protein [Phanerochaete sordida]